MCRCTTLLVPSLSVWFHLVLVLVATVAMPHAPITPRPILVLRKMMNVMMRVMPLWRRPPMVMRPGRLLPGAHRLPPAPFPIVGVLVRVISSMPMSTTLKMKASSAILVRDQSIVRVAMHASAVHATLSKEVLTPTIVVSQAMSALLQIIDISLYCGL